MTGTNKLAKISSKIKTALVLALSWAVYGFSFLVPRDPSLWVFYGWHRNERGQVFADNSKYAFLYASARGKATGVRSVWIAEDERLAAELRERGYRAVVRDSLAGIGYALRAGYTFADAYLLLYAWRYSGSSRLVQLWHGVAMKSIDRRVSYPNIGTLRSKATMPQLYRRNHLLIAASEYQIPGLARAFPRTEGRAIAAGHPRNDAVLASPPDSDLDAAAVPADDRAKKKILYCPTYRSDGSNPLEHLDLGRLVPLLDAYGAELYVQMHPKGAGQSFEGSVQEHFPIHALKGSLDIYPILRKFDICITDYSSLALDFLVLDRPILYYQYDLDTYAATAGFEDSYQDLIAGPQARTQEEFRDALEAALSGQDGHAAKRKKVYDLVFDRHDAGASKRVFEAVRADAGIAD